MRLVNSMLSMAALAIVAGSCNSVDFQKTKGGMPYKLFEGKKDGQKVQAGNYIKVNLTQKLNDSLLFSTYESMPYYFQVSDQTQPYDVTEVIPTLKEGDSVYAVQAIDTFMARNPGMVPPQFKKGDKIITTLKVLGVYKTPEEYKQAEDKDRAAMVQNEEAAVKNYLAKNNIQAQRVGTGTYVQILQPGQGPKITDGNFVTLMYKGSTFGGKVFDTNMDSSFHHTEPLPMVVGGTGMIKGFDEGLHELSKGAKAKLYIPSMLAYGPQPPSPDIKPFENLIFEIEVLDVKDKAPAQNNMPQQPKIDTSARH